jgi:hypothetical protein
MPTPSSSALDRQPTPPAGCRSGPDRAHSIGRCSSPGSVRRCGGGCHQPPRQLRDRQRLLIIKTAVGRHATTAPIGPERGGLELSQDAGMVGGQQPSTGWSPSAGLTPSDRRQRPRAARPGRCRCGRSVTRWPTYGLRRSQVQPGAMGWAYRRTSTGTRPAPSGRSCVTRDAGCYGAAGRVERVGDRSAPWRGSPLLSEGITPPVGAQAI